VTVVDANGRVVARGHAPEQAGDDLAPRLSGIRVALAGRSTTGTEDGDEIGLALRGYTPVLRNGLGGAVVGAVMIADPLGDPLLSRLSGAGTGSSLEVERGAPCAAGDGCSTSVTSASATCWFQVSTPDGVPGATLALTVPLNDIERARTDAQQALWLVGGPSTRGGRRRSLAAGADDHRTAAAWWRPMRTYHARSSSRTFHSRSLNTASFRTRAARADSAGA